MNLKEREFQEISNSHWQFFGCFMQQNPNAVLSLNRLINNHNFKNIIELGTHDGGLSTLFAIYCFGSNFNAFASHANEPSLYKNKTHHKDPKKFYTFDIFLRDIPRIKLITELGAIFKQIDFLNNVDHIEYVKSLISLPGKTLLLCDGGDKIKEFEIYSSSLKTGDIIMAHDWAKDEEAFNKIKDNNIWNCWESKWERGIKESCEKNNIRQIYSEEFDSCVWFCGVKI